MLKKPVLALTSDRNSKAPINLRSGDPEDWFDSVHFRSHGLNAASFDFFVNWENDTVCDEVWIKRISDSEDIFTKTNEELKRAISECDGRQKANQLYCFLRENGIREKYMIFRDVPEKRWENGTEKIVELDLSQGREGLVSYLTAQQVQERIKTLRKKATSIGKDGLTYSTSTLEGYLSKKDYFWPGDVDTVLFDQDYNVKAVIEFKHSH